MGMRNKLFIRNRATSNFRSFHSCIKSFNMKDTIECRMVTRSMDKVGNRCIE